jgi:hypothetical protein
MQSPPKDGGFTWREGEYGNGLTGLIDWLTLDVQVYRTSIFGGNYESIEV